MQGVEESGDELDNAHAFTHGLLLLCHLCHGYCAYWGVELEEDTQQESVSKPIHLDTEIHSKNSV